MPHAALDLRFHSNPKVLEAGNAAIGLYARALSYCADQLTDGRVPGAWAKQNGSRAEIATLTNVGLWVEHGGDYLIPDYLEFNFSRERVKNLRAKKSEAGKKGAEKRWGSHHEETAITDGVFSSEKSTAFDALMDEIADPVAGKTSKILYALSRDLPPAALHAAREQLLQRRRGERPLESEGRYVSSLLKDWKQDGRYNGAVAA